MRQKGTNQARNLANFSFYRQARIGRQLIFHLCALGISEALVREGNLLMRGGNFMPLGGNFQTCSLVESVYLARAQHQLIQWFYSCRNQPLNVFVQWTFRQ